MKHRTKEELPRVRTDTVHSQSTREAWVFKVSRLNLLFEAAQHRRADTAATNLYFH